MTRVDGVVVTGEFLALKFREGSDFGDVHLRVTGKLNGVSIGIRRDRVAGLATATPGQTISLLVSVPYLATSKAGNRFIQWFTVAVLEPASGSTLPTSPKAV